MRMDCKCETEKWFRENFFKENQIEISQCTKSDYEGVDSYQDSPIWQSHHNIVDFNKFKYHPKSGLPGSKSELDASRAKFCEKFDDAMFIEKRRKCQDKIEGKFGPKCIKEQGGWKIAMKSTNWRHAGRGNQKRRF